MNILTYCTIVVITAGKKRTSYPILPSHHLSPVSKNLRRHSTNESIHQPELLEKLLLSPDFTSNLADFFDPREYTSVDSDESYYLAPGRYELVPTPNPFLRHQDSHQTTWFAVAGINERIGMPLACWTEYIARGLADIVTSN
jgi:hypothetical protein